MPPPCPAQLRVCRQGQPPATGAVVVVVVPPPTPGQAGVAGWDQLQPLLAGAAGVPAVGRLWVRYGEDGSEEEVVRPDGRNAWKLIAALDPGDTLVVEAAGGPGVAARGGRGAGGGGDAELLPAEEQNSKRLNQLFLTGKREICIALVQVRVTLPIA